MIAYGIKVRALAAVVAAAVIFVQSCKNVNERKAEGGRTDSESIVGGKGEQTFAQRYHLKISLPMPEQQFLAVLKRLKLSYEVVGERGTGTDVLVPLHTRSLDLTKIKRSYQIYGDVGRIGKKYRAYVDTNNQVVYVENAFSYPPL